MKVEIDPQTASYIKEVAALGNTSPETLAAQMLTQQAHNEDQAQYWRERAADMAALETMQNGQSINHDDMKAHFKSLREKAQERL